MFHAVSRTKTGFLRSETVWLVGPSGPFFERGAETPGPILCHSGTEIAMSFRPVDYLAILKDPSLKDAL